jgi:beta-lactamase superfamily II metal-dependent hydrolase
MILAVNFASYPVYAEANLYKIYGYVDPDLSNGNRSGFLVELEGNSIQAVSDSDGYFELRSVPDNSSWYTVIISKEGYLQRQIAGVKVTGDLQFGSPSEPFKMWAGDMKINGVQDNAINMTDIMEVASHFNTTSDDERYITALDINSDKAVNMSDIVIVAAHFNQTPTDYPEVKINHIASASLRVSFIDVGKADSIFIETPCGKSMLIDAGHAEDGISVISYIKNAGYKKLDVVVGTHPHKDHLGGMSTVINSLEIGKMYLPKVQTTNEVLNTTLKAMQNKGLKADTAKAGVSITLDPDLKIDILAPKGNSYQSLNDYSTVIKITYKNTSFLFSADANTLSESEMLAAGYDLKSNVLKVGHHGSNKATSSKYLKAVSPKYAVICVGPNDDNDPQQETLNKLAAANVKVFRTDLDGTITATSDGNTIIFH